MLQDIRRRLLYLEARLYSRNLVRHLISGSVKYDKKASWYDPFFAELMMVADSGPRGRNDDQFDSFSYLGLTIDQHYEAQSEEELEEEAYDIAFDDFHDQGRCSVTGY